MKIFFTRGLGKPKKKLHNRFEIRLHTVKPHEHRRAQAISRCGRADLSSAVTFLSFSVGSVGSTQIAVAKN